MFCFQGDPAISKTNALLQNNPSDCQQALSRNVYCRCFNISCPRNHRYLPNTRTNRAGFCICTYPIVAQRQYGAQFPEKLDLVAAGGGRVGGQDQLVDQSA